MSQRVQTYRTRKNEAMHTATSTAMSIVETWCSLKRPRLMARWVREWMLSLRGCTVPSSWRTPKLSARNLEDALRKASMIQGVKQRMANRSMFAITATQAQTAPIV